MKSLQKIFSAKAVLLIVIFLSEVIISQSNVAILYSGYTESKLDDPKKVFDEITSWELFLMENKISYKVIYDEDIESGIEDDFDILILPSVDYISEQEFVELTNFITSGNSIINAGSKLYTFDGYNNDLNNLERLFSLSDIRFLDDKSKNYLHTLDLNTLNGFNSEDAGMIQIVGRNNLLVAPSDNNNFNSCGSIIISNDNVLYSSIIFGIEQNSKFLWTGFGINDLIGGKQDNDYFKKLILNSIKWMDNEKDAFAKLEFEGNNNPLLLFIEMNNALEPELLDAINKNGISFHLIVNPNIDLGDSLKNKVISSNIILDLSSLSMKAQDEDLIRGKISKFEDKYSLKINSVLINSELYSKEYFNFFSQLEIRNIFVNSNLNGIPEIVGNDQIVIPISKKTKENLSTVFNSIYYIPEFNCKANAEDSLLILLNNFAKAQNIFCSIEEFRNWWLTKSNLRVHSLKKNENGIEIVVSNNSTTDLINPKLYLDSFNESDYKNISVLSNGALLQHSFNNKNGLIEIELGEMFAKSNKKIIVKIIEE